MNAVFPMPYAPIPQHLIMPALLELWKASGIEQEPGDKSWIVEKRSDDLWPRIQEALLYAQRTQKPYMKFGPRPLLAHQLFGINIIHNFPGLEENYGLSPTLEGLKFAFHDCSENLADLFRELGKEFTSRDAEKVIADMGRIVDDPAAYVDVRQTQTYMTDLPDLHGDARIFDQEKRSFDGDGLCRIGYSKQLNRGIDKLAQGEHDVWAHHNGYMSDEALPSQYAKAMKKSFVRRFPLYRENTWLDQRYEDVLCYFEARLGIKERKPLPPAANQASAPRLSGERAPG